METFVNRHSLLGIHLDTVSLTWLINSVFSAINEQRRLTITYINPNYAVAAKKSPQLTCAINRFDVVLADGIGVVAGAKILGIPVPERLGTDRVCPELFRKCAQEKFPLKIFLLGSRTGIANQAARNLETAFPPVVVVGTYNGWFDSHESERIVDMINSSGADMLLVCMGTPRQQFWVESHAAHLHCPVIMTGGAYLDHLAASVEYYPEWIDRARLNWLYRLCTEPKNVWKRYTLEAAVFSVLILKQFIGRRRLQDT